MVRPICEDRAAGFPAALGLSGEVSSSVVAVYRAEQRQQERNRGSRGTEAACAGRSQAEQIEQSSRSKQSY